MDNLVSIIIPIYNTEPYIHKCMDSIINQTYGNLEIILIDDGSTDKSGSICDEYSKGDNRVKVVHRENGGQSSARNLGIEVSKGKYIGFIDSDDYVDEKYVEYLLSLILYNNDDMSICNTYDFYENGNLVGINEQLVRKLNPENALEIMLYEGGFDTGPCAKLYKKSLFHNLMFPENKIYEDFEIMYKIIDRCESISYGGRALYYYLHHRNSTMTTSFSDKNLNLIYVSEQILEFIKIKYPQITNAAIRRYVYSNHHLLNLMCDSKNYSKILRNKIINNIKCNSKTIILDKKSSKKDKVGVLCLLFGFHFYRMIFNLMKKVSSTNI